MNVSDIFSWAGAISGTVFGAIASVATAEIRERWKEKRTKKTIRKTLGMVFTNKISGDCNLMQQHILDSRIHEFKRDRITREDLLSSLNRTLWDTKQVDIYHNASDVADDLSNYFMKLDILIGKLVHDANSEHICRWCSDEDISNVIVAGNTALSSLKKLLL